MNKPDIWYIKETVPIFSNIPDVDLAPLQSLLSRVYYKPEDVITVPGKQAPCVYFLKEGRVRLSQLGPDGREVTLDYLEAGEIFGALDFNRPEKCEVYAVAVTPAAVCEIPRVHFENFITQRPDVLFEVTKILGARLTRIQMRLHDLLFLDVRGRILETLRFLAQDYGEVVPGGVRLQLRLTHLELARLVGSSRETVSAELGLLKTDGLVNFDDKRPVLQNTKIQLLR